jgi:hypothetical protein
MKSRPAYFSPSWTAFQVERGRDFSMIVDGISIARGRYFSAIVDDSGGCAEVIS